MKFEVGDKVRVRKDLALGKNYCMTDGTRSGIVSGMLPYAGEVVTIYEASPVGYELMEVPYNWTDDMFEPEAVGTATNDENFDKKVKSYEYCSKNTDRLSYADAGQRVEYIGRRHAHLIGKLATIVGREGDMILVEFDEEIPCGHDGYHIPNYPKGRAGFCWYCEPFELEFIASDHLPNERKDKPQATNNIAELNKDTETPEQAELDKYSADSVKVRCGNCKFYDVKRARCNHPMLNWDDSVSSVWLDMGPDDFCSRGEPKKIKIKPAIYSGKIVCVESSHEAFALGKAYNCVNGNTKGDDGLTYFPIRKLNNDENSVFYQLGEKGTKAKFIAVSN